MSTTTTSWLSIEADEGVAGSRVFEIDRDVYTKIKESGLAYDFESAAFGAIGLISDRIQIAEDVFDVDLAEEFELSQGPSEALPALWYVEYQPRTEKFVVMENAF